MLPSKFVSNLEQATCQVKWHLNAHFDKRSFAVTLTDHTHYVHLAHASFWVGNASVQLLCQAEACHHRQAGRAVQRTAHEAHALSDDTGST